MVPEEDEPEGEHGGEGEEEGGEPGEGEAEAEGLEVGARGEGVGGEADLEGGEDDADVDEPHDEPAEVALEEGRVPRAAAHVAVDEAARRPRRRGRR